MILSGTNQLALGKFPILAGRYRMGALLALLLVLAACGGGGGGSAPTNVSPPPPPPPPSASFDLRFPAESALTDASAISIVGEPVGVQASTVVIKNGNAEVDAILGANGLWRASDVPLEPGANSLVAEVLATDGSVVDIAVATIESVPVLSSPVATVWDASANQVFIVDSKQLLAHDLATQQTRIVSSANVGSGPRFISARHGVLANDGSMLVAEFGRVLRVDPVSGDRVDLVTFPSGTLPIGAVTRDRLQNRLITAVLLRELTVADLDASPVSASSVTVPPGVFISAGPPTDGAYVPGTDSVYTVGLGSLGITAIEVATGDWQLIDQNGPDGFILNPSGIAYDDAMARLFVMDFLGAVRTLDPASGSHNELFPPAAPAVNPLYGLSIGNDRLWSVSSVAGELVSIDPQNGAQSVRFSSSVGSGAPSEPMALGSYDENTGRVIAIAGLGVVAIDPVSGAREAIANLVGPTNLGQTPSFSLFADMVLSGDGQLAWLIDALGPVLEVDLNSGLVTEISGASTGMGPLPDQLAAIAVNDSETTAYLVERVGGRVFTLDLATGQRDLLADLSADISGKEIRSAVMDGLNNRLLLNVEPFSPASTVAPGIFALDLGNLDLTLVADLSPLRPAPQMSAPSYPSSQMSLSPSGDAIYYAVHRNPDVAYARVDLSLGTAAAIGDAASGPPIFIPTSIVTAADGRLYGFDATSALFALDEQTGERAVVSK